MWKSCQRKISTKAKCKISIKKCKTDVCNFLEIIMVFEKFEKTAHLTLGQIIHSGPKVDYFVGR